MNALTLEERVARLEAWARRVSSGTVTHTTSRGAPAPAPRTAAPAADVASDADLDAKYGDPDIRRDPKFWTGASCVGRRMSQCTPDYLDGFAKYKDASATANEKEGDPARAKYIGYDRKDAKLARGWARRLRSRASPAASPDVSEEDLPF